MGREETVRTLDLFCGGGGSSWGARNAGAEIVCGVDAWPLATRTYGANFGDGLGVNLTLRERGRVPLLAAPGDIDLILASPECRSHTCARGSGQREESSRRTARYVVRFARKLKPRWLIMENVIHIRSWDRLREPDRGDAGPRLPRDATGARRDDVPCAAEAPTSLRDVRS